MTIEKQQEILDLYEQELSTYKVAEILGLSKTTISNVLKAHEVKAKPNRFLDESFVQKIIEEYTVNNLTINEIKLKYKLGKPRIKNILQTNSIQLRTVKRNARHHITEYYNKYPILKGTQSYLIESLDGRITYKTKSVNDSGYITSLCKKEYGVNPPSPYQAQERFCNTETYWWEDYFRVSVVDDKPLQKCPYCDYATEKDEFWKRRLLGHIITKHNKTKAQFLDENPNEREAFKTKADEFGEDENNYVICQICGKKLSRLDNLHLQKHGITKLEYICKYGNGNLTSVATHDKLYANYQAMQKYMEEHSEEQYSTAPEIEIMEFIKSLGVTDVKKSKTILANNKELDIYVESKHLAIEYNGCYWHTERWKKNKDYHLNKTLECEQQGIKLIQIFEDEYKENKDLVLAKIRHALHMDDNLLSIMGRKCVIRQISRHDAKNFLTKYHIQQYVASTVYLGAFYQEELIGAMSCTQKNDKEWELTRLATKYEYKCQGVASKLFSYFIKLYDPEKVKSFADRRWTTDANDNVYTIMGFTLEKILKPDYRYYSPKVDKTKRIHKFNCRKQKLSQTYNLPKTMTEQEMAKIVGLERIWDCGLYKYVWSR